MNGEAAFDWEDELNPKPAPPTPSSYDYQSVLFNLILPIMAQIDDYPTLTCLSMTCYTFYDYIHNSAHPFLPTAFANLEREIASDKSFDHEPGTLNRRGNHGRFCNPWDTTYPTSDTVLNPNNGKITRCPNTGDYICNYDILRHNTCQLPTLEWLPCYGCGKLKRAATQFFSDQRRDHHSLLGCAALQRRCIPCSIWEDFRFDYSLRYCVDMPKGLTGYRLRCSACRGFEWSVKRPRRRQAVMKLCALCFEVALRREEPEVLLREEWRVFAGMPVENSRVKKDEEEDDDDDDDDMEVVVVDDEIDVLDVHGLVGELKCWTPFEVLSLVDAG